MSSDLHIIDAGLLPYRPAWDMQLQFHEQVLAGVYPAGVLMLVEHPPVITIGRRANAERNLLASPAMLQARGVELVETDRGGDITFHGPGQLVVYPIIHLNAYHLNLHGYMRLLEGVVIEALAAWGVEGLRSKGATGVWVRDDPPRAADGLAKVCAMGVKLRRWVTLHGLALNVGTDLSYFDLINPCGLSRPVTSLRKILGDRGPSMPDAKASLVAAFKNHLAYPA